MNDPSDDDLYRDPELAQFYDLENDWDADFDYCAALANAAVPTLEASC